MDASTSPEVHRRTMPLHHRATVNVPGLSERNAIHPYIEPGVSASTSVGPETRTVSVATDATSSALARIFILLATLSLVPVATRSARSEQDFIDLRLSFENVGELQIDRLCRKLLQLTETVSVDATERLRIKTGKI